MLRRTVLFTLVVAALIGAASCASTPAAKPQAAAAPEEELATAKGLQGKIEKYGLMAYDEESYAAALSDLKAGESSYGVDNESSKKSLQAAIDGFNAVAAKGWPAVIAKVQGETESKKAEADGLLAPVAVKDDYAKADVIYQSALQGKTKNDMENAYADFVEAGKLFAAAAELAGQKREAALQALNDAQNDMSASEQTATDAQQTLEQEGITVPENDQ